MADKPTKPRRRIKQSETVREKAKKSAEKQQKTKSNGKVKTTVKGGINRVNSLRKKEYFLPMPNNKFGRFLNKKRHFIPSYFRNSFREVKQVEWPNRKETTQLTIAVFIFAIVFGVLITVTDYGLDKLFKKVLLK